MAKSFSIVFCAILTCFATFVVGGPLEGRATNTSSLNTTQEYYLKTEVIYGGPYRFNGLYVQSYHTGAGLSDATLGRANSIHGFLNDTHQEFDFGTTFPWGLTLASDTNYAQWQFVFINAGNGGSDGFIVNGSGLVQTYGQFGGWLACDWWHGVPQLFWLYSYYRPTIPSSCARVRLVPEYV